jgi:hypothetical protein
VWAISSMLLSSLLVYVLNKPSMQNSLVSLSHAKSLSCCRDGNSLSATTIPRDQAMAQ